MAGLGRSDPLTVLRRQCGAAQSGEMSRVAWWQMRFWRRVDSMGKAPAKLNTRNEALEFARRARMNLEFIERSALEHPDSDVYVVTQLTLSLLGMVVFPEEKLLLDEIDRVPLATLVKRGWPKWRVKRDDPKEPTVTLGQLLRHVRNAVAHGRITFTSDSPKMDEVGLLVEDKRNRKDPAPYWIAEIGARQLKVFCGRFLDFIDNTIG